MDTQEYEKIFQCIDALREFLAAVPDGQIVHIQIEEEDEAHAQARAAEAE